MCNLLNACFELKHFVIKAKCVLTSNGGRNQADNNSPTKGSEYNLCHVLHPVWCHWSKTPQHDANGTQVGKSTQCISSYGH